MKRQMLIIYPERRIVTEDEIRVWAEDSYFNHADRYRCNRCGKTEECECVASRDPVYDDPDTRPPLTFAEQCDWLEDQGEVTFARGGEERGQEWEIE